MNEFVGSDIELACAVCSKPLEQYAVRTEDSPDENFLILCAEDTLCSLECRRIFDETWRNLKPICSICNRPLRKKEMASYALDFIKRERRPKCEKCLYGKEAE